MFKTILLLLIVCLLSGVAVAQPFDNDYKVPVNGAKLHFRVRGENPKNPYLLVVHGGPGFSAHMFYPWGKSIEKSVNVVYMDQYGSGESERLVFKNAFMPTKEETANYTIPRLLKDIEGVREHLKIDRWYVLGHSWGGMLGLEYVTTFPDRVLGFLFVDGLHSQPLAQEALLQSAKAHIADDEKSDKKERQDRAKRLKQYIPYAEKLTAGPERLFSTMQFAMALFNEIYYADPVVGTAYNGKIAEAVKAYNIPLSNIAPANEPPLALMRTENYATRDDTALLAKVRCPTLVINGKQDGIILPKNAKIVQEGIKGATLLILDNCGHFPFAEKPQAFTEAVLNFVRIAR